jgi:hypothetical protein
VDEVVAVLRCRLGAPRSSIRARTRILSGATSTGATGSRSSSTKRRRETLFLQNERYQDEVIIERLVRALRRGVKMHILARPAHTLKKGKLVEGVEGLRILQDIGAKVHKLKGSNCTAR